MTERLEQAVEFAEDIILNQLQFFQDHKGRMSLDDIYSLASLIGSAYKIIRIRDRYQEP